MYLCLRIDLDYVPWDSPDAAEFGHGEPASLVRLLELGRQSGYKFHFFASERALRAFPSNAEAILNDGHDLDWLCKRPDQGQARFEEAQALLASQGHVPIGLAVRTAWPEGTNFAALESMRFVSAGPGNVPSHLRHFPVDTKSFRDAVRAGTSVRSWTDGIKAQVREAASRHTALTVVVRPQALAKLDARLVHFREVLDLARAVDLPVRTLRDLLSPTT